MTRRTSPLARPLAALLGAGLVTSVAMAQPTGQGRPAAGTTPPPASGAPASVPGPADVIGTSAPGAVIAPAAPTTTPAKAPPAAPNPPKPSPQQRAVLSQVEKRITDLHDKLHVTTAQQPLWDGFAETMRQNAREMDAAADQRRRGAEAMTAKADMQSYADLAQMHATQVGKLAAAFAKLYDAMPDEQKKQADAAFKAFQTQASAGRRPG